MMYDITLALFGTFGTPLAQKFHVESSTIYTCNKIPTINQNFMLNQLALHTYIHITASIVDPHELS